VKRRDIVRLPAMIGTLALPRPSYALSGIKPDLRHLNERPLNAETPAHLLDESLTSARYMFVRNNGIVPIDTDAASWSLTIDGEACASPRSFGLADLERRFDLHRYALTLECGGNGRAEFFSARRW
tara:strand:- start:1054 stop:1431 length:378 start_codon:yes stop_codon:yes gene_type:complete